MTTPDLGPIGPPSPPDRPPPPGGPPLDTTLAGGPPPPRRSRASTALVAVSVALLLALGLTGYLYWTTDRWQQRADSAAAAEAEARAQLAAATAERATVRTQLEASNARLLELAGENAQTADEREALRQLAEENADLARQNAELATQQNEIAVAAAEAASRLAVCATSQDRLLGLVIAIDEQDPAEVQAQAAQVDADCAAAQEASAALGRLLED